MLWDTAAQEQKTKTAVEAPENPKNPLNDNVNVDVNEKENDYANDEDNINEKGNGYVNEYVDDDAKNKSNEAGNVKDNSFEDFLKSITIPDDFDEYEEDEDRYYVDNGNGLFS